MENNNKITEKIAELEDITTLLYCEIEDCEQHLPGTFANSFEYYKMKEERAIAEAKLAENLKMIEFLKTLIQTNTTQAQKEEIEIMLKFYNKEQLCQLCKNEKCSEFGSKNVWTLNCPKFTD